MFACVGVCNAVRKGGGCLCSVLLLFLFVCGFFGVFFGLIWFTCSFVGIDVVLCC